MEPFTLKLNSLHLTDVISCNNGCKWSFIYIMLGTTLMIKSYHITKNNFLNYNSCHVYLIII